MELPMRKPLTVEEYILMTSRHTGSEGLPTETYRQLVDSYLDSQKCSSEHDLVIDDDYNVDIETTLSEKYVASNMEHNRETTCQGVPLNTNQTSRENEKSVSEYKPDSSELRNQTAIAGPSRKEVLIAKSTDNPTNGADDTCCDFVPILPLPVSYGVPVFNSTAFMASSVASNSSLQNTEMTSGCDNNLISVNNNANNSLEATDKHKTLSISANKSDTKTRLHNTEQFTEQHYSNNDENSETGPEIKSDHNLQTEMHKRPSNLHVNILNKCTESADTHKQAESPFGPNTDQQPSDDPTPNSIQVESHHEHGIVTATDSLTDTINRVAAGEGIIRQRFTPKAKRKKPSDFQRKPVVGNTQISKQKLIQHKAKGLTSAEERLLESLNNTLRQFDIREIAKRVSSKIGQESDKCTESGNELENHYLLNKPKECDIARLNFDPKIKDSTKIDHYLLQTPPPKSDRRVPSTSRTAAPRSSSSDSLKVQPENSIDKFISAFEDPNKKVNESPQDMQCCVTPVLTTRPTHVDQLTMVPTVSLEKLKGVSANITVNLNNQLNEISLTDDVSRKPEYRNTQFTQKQTRQVSFDQLEREQPVYFQESSTSSANRDDLSGLSIQSKHISRERGKAILRTAISDKNSEVYVIPKPNKTDISGNSNKVVPSKFVHNQTGNIKALLIPSKSYSNPSSPNVITKEIYQQLVTNKEMGQYLPYYQPETQSSIPSSTFIEKQAVPSTITAISSSTKGIPEYRGSNNQRSNMTVAKLLAAKRLEVKGINCSKACSTSDHLKLPEQIEYGNVTNSARKIPLVSHVSLSSQQREQCHRISAICPQDTAKASHVVFLPITAPSTKPSELISTQSSTLNKCKSENIFENAKQTLSFPSSTANRCVSDSLPVSSHSAFTTYSQKCTVSAEKSIPAGYSTQSEHPISIKVGDKMYVVRPTMVFESPKVTDQKISPRKTLPAPKPKSTLCVKRPLMQVSCAEFPNKQIMKKIKSIRKKKIGPFEKLAKSLELMPKHKKEKRIRQMLKKRSKLIFSPSTMYSNLHQAWGNDSFNSDVDNKETATRNEGAESEETRRPEVSETNKVALTMLITKSHNGKYHYAIHRTKINFMPRQSQEFRRWFKYSNYPCTLHFSAGNVLGQIDVAPIKQGLYLLGCWKSLKDMAKSASTRVSAVLAPYPPHIAAIPNNSDAIVIGHIATVNDTEELLGINKIDDVEKMLNVLLGPKALKSRESFSDERYKSVVDRDMSPKHHSALFYSQDLQNYTCDGDTAWEPDCLTNGSSEQYNPSRNRGRPVDYKELDNGKAFMKCSEKAMALKIKQKKLMECCRKLTHKSEQS